MEGEFGHKQDIKKSEQKGEAWGMIVIQSFEVVVAWSGSFILQSPLGCRALECS